MGPDNPKSKIQNPKSDHSALSTQHWTASIRVTLKPVVNDPPGLAMRDALHNLGYEGVREVRSGKLIQVYFDAASQSEAEAALQQMCQRLLANPVIEDYTFDLQPVP